MTHPVVLLYFDFVDPLSYVWSRALALRTGGAGSAPAVAWVGYELRPPPSPLTATDDPMWEPRWRRARAQAATIGVELAPPRLVPWTRKAHEALAFASERGAGETVRASIFDAYFARSLDIGRVDVLVDIVGGAGLDRTEAKAALDVDRYEADVVSARAGAEASGVRDVPCLSVDGRLVEGFTELPDLGTFLPDR